MYSQKSSSSSSSGTMESRDNASKRLPTEPSSSSSGTEESQERDDTVCKNLPDEIYLETKPENQPSQGMGYDSGEHRDMGNFAFYEFLGNLKASAGEDKRDFEILEYLNLVFVADSATEPTNLHNPYDDSITPTVLPKVTLSNKIVVSPGEIVALAGDFLGTEHPICFGKDDADKRERFEEAFNELETQDPEKIARLLEHIAKEAHMCSPHAHWTLRLKKEIRRIFDVDNIEYAIEAAPDSSFKGFWHSPYFGLAMRNFDHFGGDAKEAYLTGHRLAVELAQKAGIEDDPEVKRKLLCDAFLREFFACHFLTDLFAGGHVRTPRRQILNYLTSEDGDIHRTPDLENISEANLTIAGFFARKMHDEDGQGICVKKGEKGKNDENWMAMGDGNYYEKKNKFNAQVACETVVSALNDLVLAYKQKQPLLLYSFAEDYMPRDVLPEEEPMGMQPEPLFYVEDNKLYCRGDVFKNAEEQGLLEGVKKGMPCSHTNAAMVACRFFNVKVVPAGRELKEGVQELSETAVKELHQTVASMNPKCSIF